jgi:hypothetical protein
MSRKKKIMRIRLPLFTLLPFEREEELKIILTSLIPKRFKNVHNCKLRNVSPNFR